MVLNDTGQPTNCKNTSRKDKDNSLGFIYNSLDHTNSVCNIQSIIILRQSHVALLQSSWGNKSVDLFALNVVKIPYCCLDLTLVGLNVNNKYKCVAVFDELHGRLSCEWVLDDGVLVQSILLGGALSLVLGLAVKLQSFWAVEMNPSVDTGPLLGDSLLEGFRNCCCLAYNHRVNNSGERRVSRNTNTQQGQSDATTTSLLMLAAEETLILLLIDAIGFVPAMVARLLSISKLTFVTRINSW
jgi:hypothetical protein